TVAHAGRHRLLPASPTTRGAGPIERGYPRLAPAPAPVGTEALLDRGAHRVARDGTWTPAASRNASTFAWSLRPGSASTPETTSTAKGRTSSMAPATFSAVRPPARIIGTFERRFAASSQSKRFPVPPRIPCP